MEAWYEEHQQRYSLLVAEKDGEVIAWDLLEPSHRGAIQRRG